MSQYVAAIDQGTTSTRCMVFDHDGRVVSAEQREHRQQFPHAGWVEHDPLEIWTNTKEVTAGALARAGLTSSDIAAVGITNQRETTVVWDRRSGEPVHNAIVWQDTRTARLCAELGDANQYQHRT
ncbi:MAG: FGGY family carbohydrate kinase, partial [Pseudonocardiaceae bacterium]